VAIRNSLYMLQKTFYCIFIGFWVTSTPLSAQNDSLTHPALLRLLKAYPDHFKKAEGNFIYWKDGTAMPFDDGIFKTEKMMSDSADLEDQLCGLTYFPGCIPDTPGYGCSPGTYRYYPFFKKMYGASEAEVRKHLTSIWWPTPQGGQKLVVTKVNNIHLKLQAIGAELMSRPHLKEYIVRIGGGFNWRKISGSEQYSPHSFGIAIDINTKNAHYWRWDYKNANEEAVEMNLDWRNDIPWEIVEIFEQYGFIWGGKWYHYDTMHFEYRPEMLLGN